MPVLEAKDLRKKYTLGEHSVSALYTHGYGLFRYYFLALGRHFVQRGLTDAPEDVFYLPFSQVRELVNGKMPLEDLRGEISRHKADMEHYRDILIPTFIYGDEIPPSVNQTWMCVPASPLLLGISLAR